MNIEKMREEFEAAFVAKYSNSINRDMTTKQYDDPATQTAWWGWQASRESLVDNGRALYNCVNAGECKCHCDQSNPTKTV